MNIKWLHNQSIMVKVSLEVIYFYCKHIYIKFHKILKAKKRKIECCTFVIDKFLLKLNFHIRLAKHKIFMMLINLVKYVVIFVPDKRK